MALGVVAALGARFLDLEADFPPGVTWSGCLHTDEGAYTQGAVRYMAGGQWFLAGDANYMVTAPVFHVIQALAFKVGGMSLRTARATVGIFAVAVVILTYALVRRLSDLPVALVTVSLLVVNFTFFAFSRLAIREIPMVCFGLASVLVVLAGRERTFPLRVGAGSLLFAVAILTKLSVVAAFPAFAFVVVLGGKTLKQKLLAFGCAVLLVVGAVGGYHLVVRWGFPDDYACSLGVTIKAKVPGMWATLMSVPRNAVRVVWNARAIGVLMWPMAIIFAGAACVVPEFRRSRLLWGALIWTVPFCLMLVAIGYMPPRYFLPVVIPVAAVFALACTCLYRRFRSPLARGAVVAGVALVVATDAGRTLHYLARTEHSFVEMVRDIRARIESDRPDRVVLLGFTASTVSLATGYLSINDELGAGDLRWKLRTYEPNYYISRGQKLAIQSVIAEAHELELLAVYDAFGNYFKGRRVHFYRIRKRAA